MAKNFRRPGVLYTEGDAIKPCNVVKHHVEDFARRMASVAEFKLGDDPAEIVERLGGSIHYADLDEWASEDGSIFIHGESDFDILLSHYTSPLRDRFTVAHELGHYFLHSEQGSTPIIAHRKGSTRIEWEANWFAAGLLMPSEPFKKYCEKHSDLARIAAKFGVSEDAARVRRDAICPK